MPAGGGVPTAPAEKGDPIKGNRVEIVVLDGHTLNPGDLSWEGLASLGGLTVHERTAPEEVVVRAADADIVITNKTRLDRAKIEALQSLRYIGVLATGYDVVDVRSAGERGVVVSNVPTYGTTSVAQAAFALLIELTNHVGLHSHGVREGRWSASLDFCYWEGPLVELAGLTLGILGFGAIGRAVAGIARAFGMKVITHTLETVEDGEATVVGLDELFRQSDVLSLHCPLTPQTRGVVSAARLSLMKRTAFIINTARGPLVDESALAEALNSGTVAGAGVDVLSTEPPAPDNPLLSARNCVVTPHVAWATRASRERLMATAVENVRCFLAGRPQNTVG